MLEREQLIEIVVAVSAVFLMLATMVVIGSSYGTGNGGLSPEGGQLLVAVITGFILLLTAIGIGLAYVLNDPDDGDDTDAQGSV